jgi:hypothetical protein
MIKIDAITYFSQMYDTPVSKYPPSNEVLADE